MADLIGLVSLLKTSEGGRAATAYSGFSPVAKLPAGGVAFTMQFMSDDSLNAGESDAAVIEVARPEACADLNVGDAFDIYDGPRHIGNVKILENTWRDRNKPKTARLTALTPVLGVSSLERSVAFYLKLGFTADQPRRDRANLSFGDLRLVLATDSALSNAPDHRAGRRTLTLTLHTDDAATLHKTLTDAGLKPSPACTADGHQQFDLSDPDGYQLLFSE